MRYRRDLDRNTEAPPAKSNLETAKIYLRSPKGLKGPAQAFPFVVEPGKFDITDSFIDTEKQASLHLLARTNAPKPPTKKAPGQPAEGGDQAPASAARGDFTSDVLDFIKSAYNTDLDASQIKPISPDSHGRKGVPYKGATFDLGNNKILKVYFHGEKSGPAQVALIFEGTKESLRGLSSQIDYSLNSLVLGPKATSIYGGQDELAAEEGAAPPGGVF
jgi:hypothetical protein